MNTFPEVEFKPSCLNYQAILALSRASRKVKLFKMLLTTTQSLQCPVICRFLSKDYKANQPKTKLRVVKEMHVWGKP